MQLMRRADPQAQEDGFHQLRPYAAENIDDLLTAFHQEPDHGLRCWLLELIAEARSPAALPLLTDQLTSTSESLRDWAVHGLEQLDTQEARRALYRARTNTQIT
jgi:HEAT repeat protein